MVTLRRKHRDVVFRAIADPTRREILSLLRSGRLSVGEIAGKFRTSRPAISKHLKLLRAAGLVVTRQEGAARICGLNVKPLRAVNDWLREYDAFWDQSMRSLKSYVEENLMNPTSLSDTIVKEITIHGPADRIFEALTNPVQRLKWWGAEGRYRGTHMESDLRPGGQWITRGIGVGGKPFTVRGEYRIIERPRVLVFTWLPDWEENATETLVRFDLEEKDGVTTVRLTHSGLTSESSRAHHQGWPQVLGWLKTYVEEQV